MNIEDYYLDLDKVAKLESAGERTAIHNYYRDMLTYDKSSAVSIMNTLLRGGFLKNVTQEEREEKIETILG